MRGHAGSQSRGEIASFGSRLNSKYSPSKISLLALYNGMNLKECFFASVEKLGSRLISSRLSLCWVVTN